MIIKGDNNLKKVEGLKKAQEQRIIDFLQGAIYSWCKNRKGEWFALRDLMGGDNFYWNGTPLMVLYEKHENDGASDPLNDAAIDGGWLLKKTIEIDKRLFETKKENGPRMYKWTGVEDNSI